MPFEIQMHPHERIIEVIYPQSPTADDVAKYLLQMQKMIAAQRTQWFCLVDQRNVSALSPDLLAQIVVANSYAVIHGMRRSARIVSSTAGAQQTSHLAHDGVIKVPVRSFTSRDAAIAWLTGPEEELEVPSSRGHKDSATR
jgi:hypothetical protein